MLFGRDRRRPAPRPEPELLGTVTAPSGDLLLIDFGLLRLWSGDAVPLLEPDLVDEETAAAANEAEDVELVGPDAAEVARQVDLAAVKGRYGFDLPRGGGVLAERLRTLTDRTGLQAQLRRLDRVPHARRVQLLLADDPGGVEVPFHGGWAVAVRGLPRQQPMRVLGTRMDPAGPDAGRWQSVWVEVAEGQPAAVEEAGYVLVDEARLLWADPAALSAFVSDDAADDLADLVLWGRDADTVAREVGAPALEDGEFGWTDLPADRAIELAEQLQDRRSSADVRFAFDLRPHDDHYRLLTQARSTATESGTVEVGGAVMTGFMTSWGDGAFPVYRDLARDGTLLRLRVELGAPEIVTRTRRFEERWFGPFADLAFVSTRVSQNGAPVGWLFREQPDRDDDSGWRVFAGDESQDFTDDPDHVALVPLRELLEADATLEPLLRTPAPAAFERGPDGTFIAATPPEPEDDTR